MLWPAALLCAGEPRTSSLGLPGALLVMSGLGLLGPVLREVSPGFASLIALALELSAMLLLTARACSVELRGSPYSALLRASACGLPAFAFGLTRISPWVA